MKFYQRLLCCIFTIGFIFLIYCTFHWNHKIRVINVDTKLKAKSENVKIFNNRLLKCNQNVTLNKDVENVFQPIDFDETQRKGYLYSAYFDDRQAKRVVIIAILEDFSVDLHCVVWFSQNSSITVKAIVNVIPEGSERRFTAVLIYCPIKSSLTPKHVSAIRKPCEQIHNIVRVQSIPKSRPVGMFSVCVTPLNLKYNRVDQLLEMISLNELLGATQIFFYNYSSGVDVDRILIEYRRRGFVSLIQWPVPVKVHVWPVPPNYVEEVKYFGQMAMLTDCLYRNMGHYKYVVFADLDEYLIPRRHRNWHELFAEIVDGRKTNNARAWIFRNLFFKTEWPSAPDLANNRTIAALNAMSLVKMRREKTVYSPYQRSKMIVDPLAVDVMGVHNVWQFHDGAVAAGATSAVLDETDGLCHHYRNWEGMGERTFVEDRNILRLREDIVRALQRNRKIFF